jgi:hypothetical protein
MRRQEPFPLTPALSRGEERESVGTERVKIGRAEVKKSG